MSAAVSIGWAAVAVAEPGDSQWEGVLGQTWLSAHGWWILTRFGVARVQDRHFQAWMQRAMEWVCTYLWLPSFGPWVWVNEKFPCCRDNELSPVQLAGQSRSTRSMANKLHVLSRKVLESCSKGCGERRLLLLPSCSPVDTQAPISSLL